MSESNRRFVGRVKFFRPNRNEGFITELAECGTNETTNVLSGRDVYFRVSEFSNTSHGVLLKSSTGEILEYERRTDDKGRHRAFNITGFMGTRLQCQEGILTFRTYEAAQKDYLRREALRARDFYDRSYNQGGRRNNTRSYHSSGSQDTRSTNSRSQTIQTDRRPPQRNRYPRSRSRSRSYESSGNYYAANMNEDPTHVDIPIDAHD